MRSRLLGDRTPQEFLRHYWQKRPLFVRRALPGLAEVVTEKTLAQLAARDDVESRIVERRGKRRETCHGPFTKVTAHSSGWTLLVNGVNLHVDGAHALLQRFNFVPQARLDDVMVSWAAPGGGVGPHVDSYDVFLVQGMGRRLWRLQRPRAFRMLEGAPLRLIADFSPDEEYLVEPGDLLYVPPGWAHDGVALEECQTCSVGLRAPQGEELAAAFLDFLHERGLPPARYRDPGLRPARRSAQIPAAMAAHAAAVLGRIRWTRREVGEFLGRYLTTPKPHVVFAPPRRPMPLADFARRLGRTPVALDRRTLMLYRGARIYLNGDALEARPALRALADRRRARLPAALAEAAYGWYLSGYLHLERSP